MNVGSEIILLRPFWGLGLLLVIVLAALVWRRRSRLGDWGRMIDPHLMAAMTRIGRVAPGRARGGALLPFIAAGLICLALTGPARQGGDAQVFRNLGGVIFLVDVSSSMTEDPSWTSAVTATQAILSVLGSRPAALLVFAGDSYDASAFTTDRVHLSQTLSLLDAQTVPDKGSRPALALQRAATMLNDARILAGEVVLITDGGGTGSETADAATRLAATGARLSVIQVPTAAAADEAGVTARLQALALSGGGVSFPLRDVNRAMDAFAKQDNPSLERQDIRLLFWKDYGRYVLLLALVPVAALFRRAGAL